MTGRGTVHSMIGGLAVVIAAACSGPAEPVAAVDEGSTTAPPAAVPSEVQAPEAAPPQADGGNDADFDIPTVPPAPQWDEQSRRDAEAIAHQAMTAFARPDLVYDAWWAGFGPLLSVQGQELYGYVDPANVPARTVTGPAELLEEGSPFLADVVVPTDVGDYVVLLSRDRDGAGWQVERLTPPEGVGP